MCLYFVVGGGVPGWSKAVCCNVSIYTEDFIYCLYDESSVCSIGIVIVCVFSLREFYKFEILVPFDGLLLSLHEV